MCIYKYLVERMKATPSRIASSWVVRLFVFLYVGRADFGFFDIYYSGSRSVHRCVRGRVVYRIGRFRYIVSDIVSVQCIVSNAF